MHPILLELWAFKLPAYGFMVASGYIAAVVYLLRSRQSLLKKENITDLVFYCALSGIAGAKIAFAITYWPELGPTAISRLVFIFKTFPYGFVFYGGLIGGLAAFIHYCRKHALNALASADIFAPALALAHGFGRLGCFMAGCCYGAPSSGHLGVRFSSPLCEVPANYLSVPLHPVQLYEAAGNFAIFGLLLLLRRQAQLANGYIFAAYLISYSTLRFFLEFLRGDDRGVALLGISPGQLISIIAAFTAMLILISQRKNEKSKNKI